ncbi:DNA-directed RNA polymerase subunit omega [Desulfoluna butyratoxydans]|uniref:DNA-directed RNA polymerase subunit omega n=1 Tax=Desulfoluna butyratoxydans TaxID=231438 RepID=A0A4U8YQX7_9BACT|nr:DNA-directed RNA polymerase subunit omega [Desulfoluna butyratoxydans]VFQ46676.1 rna polymerase subunit omega/k/rpb6 [Desulfoluna butyratoxydans]
MARVTVEDCLEKVPNRFMLVHMASKRVRQIRDGAEFVVQSANNEDVVTALREIASGKVFLKTEDES